jgi:proteic killer suppression protein
VIVSFRHRGLERFFLAGDRAGIPPEHVGRLRLVLGRLAAAESPKDMDLPGLRLHQLKGKLKGRWSVTISGNWRITFTFDGKDAVLVDYEDYH